MSNFNHAQCGILLPGGKMLHITDQAVHDTLGLPIGGKEVEFAKSEKDKSSSSSVSFYEFYKSWKAQFNFNGSQVTPEQLAHHIIFKRQGGWDDFKRNFVVLAVSLLMRGTQRSLVNHLVLKSLMDVEEIRNYNWSKFVKTSLKEAVKKWGGVSSRFFTGSVLFAMDVEMSISVLSKKVIDSIAELDQKLKEGLQLFSGSEVIQKVQDLMSKIYRSHLYPTSGNTMSLITQFPSEPWLSPLVESTLVPPVQNPLTAVVPSSSPDNISTKLSLNTYDNQPDPKSNCIKVPCSGIEPMNLDVPSSSSQGLVPEQEKTIVAKTSSLLLELHQIAVDACTSVQKVNTGLSLFDEVGSIAQEYHAVGLAQSPPAKLSTSGAACIVVNDSPTVKEQSPVRLSSFNPNLNAISDSHTMVNHVLLRPRSIIPLSRAKLSPFRHRQTTTKAKRTSIQLLKILSDYAFLKCSKNSRLKYEEFFSYDDRTGLREDFITFKSPNHINTNIISCWSVYLNYREKERSLSSPMRFFFTTEMNVWMHNYTERSVDDEDHYKVFAKIADKEFKDASWLHLHEIKLVFMPVDKSGHFYLFVFDLEKVKFYVVDNMLSIKPAAIRLGDKPKKITMAFGRYLEESGIRCGALIKDLVPEDVSMVWQTKENFHDSGVYTMRHMETFMGVQKKWDSGFHGSDFAALDVLGMKYNRTLIMFEKNKFKDLILEKAKKYNKEPQMFFVELKF